MNHKCFLKYNILKDPSLIRVYISPDCHFQTIYGPRCEKTCLWGFVNNKDADQPAHLRSLISAFVIGLLESTISRLATSEISIF